MIAQPSTRKEVTKMSKAARRAAVRVVIPTALFLLLPLVAMQVTDGVDWSPTSSSTSSTAPPPSRSPWPPWCSGRRTTRPGWSSSVAC
jgi:hypothetical protein